MEIRYFPEPTLGRERDHPIVQTRHLAILFLPKVQVRIHLGCNKGVLQVQKIFTQSFEFRQDYGSTPLLYSSHRLLDSAFAKLQAESCCRKAMPTRAPLNDQ